MKAPRTIPPDVHERQRAASDPAVSAWVSANAGSGKTYVLAQRVIRLLLEGIDPAKVLCLTFTKAAAANMALQVFSTLAQWTALDDAALDAEIKKISGQRADAARRARARRLFAAALETPGGLKVQTIHAFCTRLLQQFPFEANVAARFSVLDEAATGQLLDRLTLAVLLDAAAAPEDSPLGRALGQAIVAAADTTFKDVVAEAIGQRDALVRWIERAGGVEAAIAELSRLIGVEPGDSFETVEADYFAQSLVPMAEWPALIEVLASGSANDKKQVAALEAARAATGRARIEAYLDVFCRRDRLPRKDILTKKLAEQYPRWEERLRAEQDRVGSVIARERAIRARDRTAALVAIAAEVTDRYRAEKDRRGLLDYEDLIDKTLALFERTSIAWVLYKLDLGIDHVLIDEAQDTSEKQWQIITTIVSEFSAGAGARATAKRTIFAVGDEKQSIFSFQGAAPRMFDEKRRAFAGQFDTPELGWRYVRFHHSFRSGVNVLGSVDRVFRDRVVFASVTSDVAGIPGHVALPDAAPGVVELWPLFKPEERREIEPWDAPFDTLSEQSPPVRLARQIAGAVRLWIARGQAPGDVLILVRQRRALFEAILRALKDAGIAVAGADRLVLTEHIAVMDLMVLADALLLPDDDLALATALRSPLFNFDEDQLCTLAWNRPGSLHASLRAKAGDDPMFAAAESVLDRLAADARQLSPFEFYARVLGPLRARARILQRLGPEAADAIDEFLNLALDYERRETPSLQGFLAWLRASKAEVKRDMEIQRDEVRVMTVHGAKGLEAKTVILADTTTAPQGAHSPRLLTLPLAQAPAGAASPLVWASAQGNDVGPMADAREAARRETEDEYRRLLYVAMTRAKERLIVCGTQGARKIPDGCWYALVHDALREDCVEEKSDDGEMDVLRYRKVAAEAAAAAVEIETPRAATALPAWLRQNAPAEPLAAETIVPSAAPEDDAVPRAGSGDRRLALQRGALVHRLLQSLPDIARERRADLARRYLARAGAQQPAAERERLIEQVLRLIDDARFAPLFAPGSRAEVPIIGRLAAAGHVPQMVSGQVDRLAVTAEEILIVDYKTNRPAPPSLEAALGRFPGYLRQLALYRAVLASLFPDKAVRAALLWTDTPDLMEVSPAALDLALAQVTSAPGRLDAAGGRS